MKLLSALICLLLSLASITAIAQGKDAPAVSNDNPLPGLWLTVRFNTGALDSTNPDAEVSTLVSEGARFQQQFACPSGRYSIAGVVGSVSDGQYPLSIRLTGGPSAECGTQLRLSLNKPYTWGIINGYFRGWYTITLTPAPEWQPPNKPLHLTPPAAFSPAPAVGFLGRRRR